MNQVENISLDDLADRIRAQMAHAWMVRTFIKHSTEVEDFPDLMNVVRAVFDTARALEARGGAVGFLQMFRKKFAKLKQAAVAFRTDAPAASDHENFRQAVRSLDTAIAAMEGLAHQIPTILPAASEPEKTSDDRQSAHQ